MPPRGLADNVILVVADVLGTKLNHVFSDRLYLYQVPLIRTRGPIGAILWT
jgi:hypothetical protein